MTVTQNSTTTGGRGVFIGVLVVVGLAAAAIGAYLDWLWWHPSEAIVITLVAIAAILLAGLLFLFAARSRRGWPSSPSPLAWAFCWASGSGHPANH